MGEEMREKTVIRDGMKIDWDVPIPMDDGVVLRADVFRPIENGNYPAILSLGPYAKNLPFVVLYPQQWRLLLRDHPEVAQDTTCKYANFETADPEKWVPEGYACVRVDSRGAGRSPGFLDVFSPRETKDYYNCIEWAGVQPWCNGKVGLSGISYYAINQWLVAGLQPPHLAACFVFEGAADYYRDWHRHGGILNIFTRPWHRSQVETVQHGVGRRGERDPNNGMLTAGPETLPDEELAKSRADPYLEARLQPLDGLWYRERSADWPKVQAPLLSLASWGGQGLHGRGNVEGFVNAASEQKWLEIHGLEHWTHYYTGYGLALQKRFFDHFLKEEQNGWDREPPVQLNVRHPGEKFVLRKEQEWPLARTQWTKYYLNPADKTLALKPAGSESRAEYDPLTSNGVTFWTEPFTQETEITGPVAARLFISSETRDADLFLVVQLFDPQNGEITFAGSVEPAAPIAQGWLRASHRKLDPKRSTEYRPYHTHDEEQPLEPGKIYELDVEIWPTSIVVPAGYRLAFTVQGKDFERETPSGRFNLGAFGAFRGSGIFLHTDQWDRRPENVGGQVTVYGGGNRASYVLLPVIPRAKP